MNLKVKKLKSEAKFPSYANPGDAGFDLSCTEDFRILPGKIAIISTGLAFEIPDGYEIQIRSRSGLAAKQGLFVLNSPGTIDSGYRGEVKVILYNASPFLHNFTAGDRIAQGVPSEVPKVNFIEVTDLTETVRGDGGLGSSGVS